MDVFERLGIGKLIDSTLGMRNKSWNSYLYSNIFETIFSNYLCGGDCLEDINAISDQLSLSPNTKIPNSDTVGRTIKSLATGNEEYKCEKSGLTYKFNTAEKPNTLALKMISLLGLVKEEEEVTLDFDHQFIPGHKFDAEYSYKGDYGYFPGWMTIGGIFVGGENRDGNTNVKFHQEDTLVRIIDRVVSNLKVKLKNFRADCDSFSKDIIKAIEPRCEHFYIRASNCSARYEEFQKFKEWKQEEIDLIQCEVASFTYEIDGKEYRLVVQRSPKKNKEGEIATDIFGVQHVYRAIITNDGEMSEKDVILFYNKRGTSEKNFGIQNNDFGWAHLPFSFLNENSAFMIITAMLKNFYIYIVEHLSKHVKAIEKTSRLKKVLFHFICVPAKWIKSRRTHILKLFTKRKYYKAIFDY